MLIGINFSEIIEEQRLIRKGLKRLRRNAYMRRYRKKIEQTKLYEYA